MFTTKVHNDHYSYMGRFSDFLLTPVRYMHDGVEISAWDKDPHEGVNREFFVFSSWNKERTWLSASANPNFMKTTLAIIFYIPSLILGTVTMGLAMATSSSTRKIILGKRLMYTSDPYQQGVQAEKFAELYAKSKHVHLVEPFRYLLLRISYVENSRVSSNFIQKIMGMGETDDPCYLPADKFYEKYEMVKALATLLDKIKAQGKSVSEESFDQLAQAGSEESFREAVAKIMPNLNDIPNRLFLDFVRLAFPDRYTVAEELIKPTARSWWS